MPKRNRAPGAKALNPTWTAADFKRAKPFAALPAALKKTLSKRGRPPKESPKVPISIRLSPKVVAHFKAKGKGWQTRIDEALVKLLKGKRAA